MLDVHPPHTSVHGWRDFFIHIATITIGLLIALALEAGAEALHNRHVVREARENIRRELISNRNEIRKDDAYIQTDENNMRQNILTARALRDHPDLMKSGHNHFDFTFSWSGPSTSAWHSARDTGALALMPVTEVQSYAESYDQQQIVEDQAIKVFTSQSDATVPLLLENIDDPHVTLRPEEAAALLENAALLASRLQTLHQLVHSLEKEYTGALAR